MPLWKKLSLSPKSQTFLVDGDAAIIENPIKISHRRRHSHKLPGPKTSPGPLESVNRRALLDPSDQSLVRPCTPPQFLPRTSTELHHPVGDRHGFLPSAPTGNVNLRNLPERVLQCHTSSTSNNPIIVQHIGRLFHAGVFSPHEHSHSSKSP